MVVCITWYTFNDRNEREREGEGPKCHICVLTTSELRTPHCSGHSGPMVS